MENLARSSLPVHLWILSLTLDQQATYWFTGLLIDSWKSILDLPSGLSGWDKLRAGQELRAAACADWVKELHILLNSKSPHIVSALAPQKTERWTHSGSHWCFKGIEQNTWPQLSISSPFLTGSGWVRENSSECAVVMAQMPSSWNDFIQLKLIPLTFRACGSIFTVSIFQFTNTGLGGQFKKLHKGIERIYPFLFNLIYIF